MSIHTLRRRISKLPPPAPPPRCDGGDGDGLDPYRQYLEWTISGCVGPSPIPDLDPYVDVVRGALDDPEPEEEPCR